MALATRNLNGEGSGVAGQLYNRGVGVGVDKKATLANAVKHS